MAKRYKTIPIQINYDDQTLARNYSSTQVPTSNIAISDNGLNFMLSFDRYRGHRYWNGEKYVMGYNYDGDAFPNGITETNAYKLWLTDVTRAQNNLRKRLNNNPTFFLQHQWDALVSFYYNTGSIDHTETEGFEFDFIHFLQNGTENEIASLLQTDSRAPTRRIAEASLFRLGNYGKFKPRIWLRNEGIQDIRQNYSKLEDKDGKIDSIAQKQAQYSYYKETGRFIKDMSELDKRLIVDLAKQDTSTVVDTSTPVDRYIVKTTTDQEYSSIATTSTATTAPAVTVIDYSVSAEGTTGTTETTTGSTGSTSSQVIAAEHTHDTADWLPIGGLGGQFLAADGTWAYPSGTALTVEEQYDTSNVSVSYTNKILFDTNSGLHVTAGTSGVANVSLSTFSYDKKGGVPAPTISDNTKYLRGDGTWAALSGIQYADISGTPNLATVATTGAYGDLSGTPNLATVATTGLTVSEINDPNSNNVSVSNVLGIKFDANGGFALTDNSDGTITVGMESTFKTWKIYDNPTDTTATDIIATGVDTISINGGTGVTLAGVGTAGSKSLTMSIGQDVATTSNVTFNDVVVSGDLTVSGNTTTINTATLDVEDKNIILGKVNTPTNDTAHEGGITLKAASDKTITWDKTTDRWSFNTGIEVGGLIHIKSEITSPTVPANGSGGYIYTKADGLPYWVSYDQNEINLAQSGGGGSSNSNLSNTLSRVTYIGDGSSQHFSIAHKQGGESVYLNGVKLLAGDGSNNNDYFTVSGSSSTTYVGDDNDGTHIYFHTAPESNSIISIDSFALEQGITFKTWKIFATPAATSSTDIIASEVDTISIKAGTGITLAGVSTTGSKSLTISSTAVSSVVDDTSPQLGGDLDLNSKSIKGNILPDTDNAYDLGSATHKFKDLHLSGSTIYLGGTALSKTTSGGLKFGTTNIGAKGDKGEKGDKGDSGDAGAAASLSF